MSDADWEPKPDERTYYRSRQDGQRGYLVRRDGVDKIRLDRPMEELIRPLDGNWEADKQTHPMTAHQVARIAFVADRELCRAIGKHDLARDEWLSLPERKRIAWMKEGPKDDSIRDDLFDAIMATLRVLTSG